MKKIVVAYRRRRSFRYHSKHAYPAGREKVCNRLRWAGLIKGFDLYGYRRGGTFDSPKVPKSDLGLRPKNPVALLRWIRI